MTGRHAPAAPRSILVYVGLDLVGDGLMKLPFVRALRQAFPAASIVWLAGKGPSAYSGTLAPLVEGLIDEVVDDAGVGAGWNEMLDPLKGTSLHGRTFDLVIDTQRRVKTTLILKRIPHRVFISGAAGYLLSNRRPPFGHRRPTAMIRQMLDLLELASGQPAVPTVTRTIDRTADDLARTLLDDGRAIYVGLVPGAGGKHKCWPLDRFIDLGSRIAGRGQTPVYLLGPGESEWADTIRSSIPSAVLPLQDPRAGALGTSPLLTIALAARFTAAVANDSGGGHMLAAADIPLLSLFGPTPPAKFAPFVTRGAVLRAQDFGGGEMSNIPLQAVDDALELLLAESRPDPNRGCR
ncbi:glycosyltransferase family 9 protein [Thalassobaculum sp.]|uniref:glycosyltransferase family 9 protein n=1 Tax=Thalassobaculum sp. TaxID=2022740 RepID=UPI0032EAF89B